MDKKKKARLARVITEFSYGYASSEDGFLVQLWLPDSCGGVLTTKGSPFSIVGCSDALALYKFESSKHRPTTDGRLATCPISRVFADMQPELPEADPTACCTATLQQQEQQQQMHFDRVAEAQRAGIHSTLVLAIYDLQGSSIGNGSSGSSGGSGSSSDNDCHPVAVFELAQHEPDVDFRGAVDVLSKACQAEGFWVPQLESAESVQSWEGTVPSTLQSPCSTIQSSAWNTASSSASWATEAAAAARAQGGSSEAAEAQGGGQAADALPAGTAVRRYSCLIAEVPAAIMHLLGLHAKQQPEQQQQQQVEPVQQQPHVRRRPRRQSFIVTDYLRFYEQLGQVGHLEPGQAAAGDATAAAAAGGVMAEAPAAASAGGASSSSSRSFGAELPMPLGPIADASGELPVNPEVHSSNSSSSSSSAAHSQRPALLPPGTPAVSEAETCSAVKEAGSLLQELLTFRHNQQALNQEQQQEKQQHKAEPRSNSSISSYSITPAVQLPPDVMRLSSSFSSAAFSQLGTCTVTSSPSSSAGPMAAAVAGDCSQQQQFAHWGAQQVQQLLGHEAHGSSSGGSGSGGSMSRPMPHQGRLTSMWQSDGGRQRIVGVWQGPGAAAAAVAAAAVAAAQGAGQAPQAQLGAGSGDTAAAAAALDDLTARTDSQQAMALVRACSNQPVPGIVSGTLTEEQVAGIQLGRLCGAGSFGRVYRGVFEGQEVAIKVVHCSSSSSQQVASEVHMMMAMAHPNLCKAYHYITWDSSGQTESLHLRHAWGDLPEPQLQLQPVIRQCSLQGSNDLCGSSSSPGRTSPSSRITETWILTEFCNAGTLRDAVLEHNNGVFFEGDVPQLSTLLNVLLGVAEGMEWLHLHGIVHGDLKAANCLLTVVPYGAACSAAEVRAPAVGDAEADSATFKLVPKVADFGLSRLLDEGRSHLSTFTVGTLTHQAPELMRCGRLSKPADVFSFGVIMWEVVMAATPWAGQMMGGIMNSVMVEGQRLRFSPVVPKAYAALAEQCWREDPKQRPTFTELLLQLRELLDQVQLLQQDANALHAKANLSQVDSAALLMQGW